MAEEENRQLYVPLRRYGHQFATRERARGLHSMSLINDVHESVAVVFDWSGVVMTTGAFADELMGDLVSSGHPVSNTGMCAAVAEVVDLVVQRRTGMVCIHCRRPVFRSHAGGPLRLVHVEYSRTHLCDARGMEAGHEAGAEPAAASFTVTGPPGAEVAEGATTVTLE